MLSKKEQRIDGWRKMIYASKAPQPININWENYSYKGWTKFRRRLISWGIYVFLYILRILKKLIFSFNNRGNFQLNKERPNDQKA